MAFFDFDGDGLWEIPVGDGFDVGVDLAVEQVNDTGSVSGQGRVVSDHDDGVAFFMNGFKDFHDIVGGARVEVAGWFVGEDDFGAANDGAGDGNVLLLAARKLMGEIIFALLKVETSKNAGGGFQAHGFRIAGVNKGKGDVFNDGKVVYEVEVLENKADFFGAKFGLASSRNIGDGFTIEVVFATGGAIEKTDDIQESSLTAARRAHNHNKFTTFDGEVEIF